jgi:NADH-quinone oxidoreductase subunit M
MSILLFFILIPVLTIIGILFTKDGRSARVVAASGMFVQLIMSVALLFLYYVQRHAGNTAEMLFVADYSWFPSLNIRFTTGVDGIAVSMIMLTSTVVFAGIFASWEMEDLAREFFISLIILATGVFGFFISMDLFTMFLFYELAVIPMYLLIGIWGSGPKEYSAMKLTLMLMGGSALLLVGLLGIYFNSTLENGQHTFNLLQIAQLNLPIEVQRYFFPFTFIGFGLYIHGHLMVMLQRQLLFQCFMRVCL